MKEVRKFYAPDEKENGGEISAPKVGMQTNQGPASAAKDELTPEETPKNKKVECFVNGVSEIRSYNNVGDTVIRHRVSYSDGEGRVDHVNISDDQYKNNKDILKKGNAVVLEFSETVEGKTGYIDENGRKVMHKGNGKVFRGADTLSEAQINILTIQSEMKEAKMIGETLEPFADKPAVIKGITDLLSRRMNKPAATPTVEQ